MPPKANTTGGKASSAATKPVDLYNTCLEARLRKPEAQGVRKAPSAVAKSEVEQEAVVAKGKGPVSAPGPLTSPSPMRARMKKVRRASGG